MEEVSDNPVKCNKCGRRLLLKSSVERSMGPVCFRKIQQAVVLAAMREEMPMGIVARVF